MVMVMAESTKPYNKCNVLIGSRQHEELVDALVEDLIAVRFAVKFQIRREEFQLELATRRHKQNIRE